MHALIGVIVLYRGRSLWSTWDMAKEAQRTHEYEESRRRCVRLCLCLKKRFDVCERLLGCGLAADSMRAGLHSYMPLGK